jgi:hypothetical protein
MLVYWQQLHKLVEGIWNKVQGIETINHEIYDKLDEIQVGWKVAEDIKIKALVPKKIIPIDCYFTPISVIDGDEVLFYKRNGSYKLYKYQISTGIETEIGEQNYFPGHMNSRGVWRKSTNYYFFNGNNSIDIYNSSFVFQSSITCDMRPMYGAWVDTNKFFLKGKDYDLSYTPPNDYPSKRGVCINGNIEEWTTTKQSETKYSNYPILWKRGTDTMVYKPFMSTEGIFICGTNTYYLSTELLDLIQLFVQSKKFHSFGRGHHMAQSYWDFYIGTDVIISTVSVNGGVVYVC